jgi:hypothetical protein
VCHGNVRATQGDADETGTHCDISAEIKDTQESTRNKTRRPALELLRTPISPRMQNSVQLGTRQESKALIMGNAVQAHPR